MGILHIIVDPHAVDQPQRLQALGFPLGVVFVKGVVEIILQNGIHPDGVGAHLLDPFKPAQIGLLVDGIICGPLAGQTHAQVDAPDLKGFVSPVPLHIDGVFVGLHECGDRSIRVQIDV